MRTDDNEINVGEFLIEFGLEFDPKSNMSSNLILEGIS